MRTAEDIWNAFIASESNEEDLQLFEDVQKEAWNAAIDAASESAKTKNTQVMVNANATNAYMVGGIEVDKESILKLKK